MGNAIKMAVWDSDRRRGISLKERLEMFAERDVELYTGDWTGKPWYDACFLSFDECGEPVLRVARSVRQSSESVFILLVCDRSRDISACIRPGIRPSGVLFRPVQNAHLRDLLDEITGELDRLIGSEADDVFIFKSEGASHRVPFRDILFFEACNKKVVLHTTGQEIGYYDSIDNLVGVLPPYFTRCHRSFLVNVNKIEELRGADMELRLTGGVRIPVSRSCRDTVRQAMSGQQTEQLIV